MTRKQQTSLDPRRVRGSTFRLQTSAGTGKKAVSSAGAIGLRLAVLLFCLCAFALSACGQKTGTTPSLDAQQQSQNSALTYVAIGASDTFGIGSRDPYTENWPADLVILLKKPVHLINLGIPGITLHDALTSELPIALDAHPTLVTVWLAVNDLAANVPVESYARDLNTLLTRLQTAAPHARIAVGNVPNLTSVPFFYNDNPATLDQQIAAYNTVIANAVRSHSALLVDLSGQGYDLQAHPEYISGDGLHPSDIGYFQLARLFYSALLGKV
jgi:lysophospholipase L1-like esterase